MKTVKLLWVLVAVLFLMSCAASQFGWPGEEDREERPGGMPEYAEDFDPETLNETEPEILPPVTEEAETAAEALQLPAGEAPDTSDTETRMVPGYRIQLYAGKDEMSARELKKKAIMRFEENVYLIFEAPFWKIQVGDFENRRDADEMLAQLLRNWPESDTPWVVPTQIVQKRASEHIY